MNLLNRKTAASLFTALAILLFCSNPCPANAAQVTLSWTRPDDSRVAGYKIYYGESGTDFKASADKTVSSADTTSCSISGLVEGQNYDFAATSIDSNGNESEFSETVSYKVPSPDPAPGDVDDDGDGYTENEGDCNDSDPLIHPGAEEICGDGIDQDCSGSDLTCPEDIDNDGDTYTENQGDCNDSDPSVYPGAEEICGDGIDQDCDGSDMECTQTEDVTLSWERPDDSRVKGYNIYYGKAGTDFKAAPGKTVDSPDTTSCTIEALETGCEYSFAATSFDSEGNESDFSETVKCIIGTDTVALTETDNDGDGYTESEGDCNDSDPLIHPGAEEICGDGIDQDCSGSDLTCPEDIDNDGDTYTENQGDCNDNDPSVYPGAEEICGDGIDQDCDGSDMICPENVDDDGDGYTESEGDCNDSDPSINPGADDICGDGIDQDCSGSDAVCPENIDNDGDTYTENEGDCDDSDPSVYPGAAEICGDGIDQDCSGSDSECITEEAPKLDFEIGETRINHEWKQVSFKKTYENPVVVAKPISLNGGQPCTVRIKNVTSDGFELRIHEWEYLDDWHVFEEASYMVMEAGRHELSTGINVEAGTFETNETASVSFETSFSRLPVVISGVTSENDLYAVTGRLYNISKDGFDFSLQEQEKHKNSHKCIETISYIAWEPSAGIVNGRSYVVDSTFNEVTDELFEIQFYPEFSNPPVFLADMQTMEADDTANLRWRDKSGTSIKVQIDEEESRDRDLKHTSEAVGYMVFDSEATP